jgi:hypothetical protein
MPAARVGPPMVTPASDTPQLSPTKATERVRQLVQCGSRMYAVGTFTRISRGSKVLDRENAFSFKAEAPYTVTSWHPRVHGEVNSIAFDDHCKHAYLGGDFKKVGKRKVSNLVEVSTATGFVERRFKARPNLVVETLLMWHQHLLTGGFFNHPTAHVRHRYFASLHPTTGKDDGYLSLGISGEYRYRNSRGVEAGGNPTRVYNQQLSHNGKRLLVEGDFTRMGGKSRQQVAMLDLHPKHASLSQWHAKGFDGNCVADMPFYVRTGAWSVDDKSVFFATTGEKPATGPGSRVTSPRRGLCDAAIAFPAKPRPVKRKWINYTGCDSLYAVAADKNTVYVGGHERWTDNPLQCNNNDSGQAVAAPGMAGLSTKSGRLSYNPTRSRGTGADDMLLTKAGLWIASDNLNGSDACGGVHGHAGICLLPY